MTQNRLSVVAGPLRHYRSGEGYKRLVPHYDIERETFIWIEMHSGDKQEFSGGGRDEEGYSYWITTYTCDKSGYVWREHVTRAKDCDGRIGQQDNHILSLYSNDWVRISLEQRDHSAEAAGY